MSTSLGCLLEPATGFTGSSMTMALSNGFACASASDSWLSSVYWLNVPGDGAVVDSTALRGHGGGHMTCLAAACFAASFHVAPVVAFSDRCLVNGSITSVMHSEVRPAFLLSHGGLWHPRPSPHSIWDMWLGLSTTYSHHCCLVIYTDFQSVYLLVYWKAY